MRIKFFHDLGMVSRNSRFFSPHIHYPHMVPFIQNTPGLLEYLNKMNQDKKSDGDEIKKNIEESSDVTGQQENGKHVIISFSICNNRSMN